MNYPNDYLNLLASACTDARILSERVYRLPPVPQSIAAATINYSMGLLYSLTQCILRYSGRPMPHDKALECVHWIAQSIESLSTSSPETENVRIWLENTYMNNALVRAAACYERTLGTIVFAKCVRLASHYSNPQIRTLSNLLHGFNWERSKLEQVLRQFNEELRWTFPQLKKAYRDIQGQLQPTQLSGLDDIKKEVERIKHWVGRQFGPMDSPGSTRNIELQELLKYSSALFSTKGLLAEMIGELEQWDALRAA
jgi:hypothetical protein